MWLCIGLALLAATLPAHAREGDRQKPATIEANRAEIDRQAGQSRYYGDVVFEQGSLRLTGDRLTIESTDGVVRHANAVGEPARISQENDQGQRVKAHGRTIDYNAAEGRVILTGDAELTRGEERFAAGRIRYWPDSQRVEGGRGEDGSGDRVRIRIEPNKDDSGAGTAEP